MRIVSLISKANFNRFTSTTFSEYILKHSYACITTDDTFIYESVYVQRINKLSIYIIQYILIVLLGRELGQVCVGSNG